MSPLNRHWSQSILEHESRSEAYVIVTVLGAQGSTPRDSGTKMVVSNDALAGTIGGGQLEFDALRKAKAMLAKGAAGQWLENFPLGEKLGQCCGGSTSLLFESFVPQLKTLYLFGAGHVGRALAPILATLPLSVHWVDPRSDEFPDVVPTGVTVHCTSTPVDLVQDAAPGSYFVLMTHQHPLDYALMETALSRADAAYIGVIGSHSKWRRFRLRLEHRGHSDEHISAIRCPIGLSHVPGKRPAEIAVSVAAELVAHYHAQRADALPVQGPSWKTLRAQLDQTDTTFDSPVDLTK